MSIRDRQNNDEPKIFKGLLWATGLSSLIYLLILYLIFR